MSSGLSSRMRLIIDVASMPMRKRAAHINTRSDYDDMYPAYLVLLHMLIRASVPLMRAAVDVLRLSASGDETSVAVCGYLAKHITEECGHDQWLIEDLAVLGLTSQEILSIPPVQSVIELVGAQYYHVLHADPISLLGYIAVLEGYPMPIQMVDEREKVSRLPTAAFRTLRKHAVLDIGHRDDLNEFVDSLCLTPKAQQSIINNAVYASRLCAEVLGDLEEIETYLTSIRKAPTSLGGLHSSVDGYRLGGLLSRNGDMDVWEAKEELRQDLFVMKRVNPNGANVEACNRMLAREAEVAASVSHPNVIGIVRHAEVSGVCHNISRLFPSSDLLKWAYQFGANIDANESVWFRGLMGACAALQGMHDAGWVHRDYKPSNVLVDGSGDVRLIDFCLSARVGEQVPPGGTPGFIAPECRDSHIATVEEDIFAFGVTLCRVLMAVSHASGRPLTADAVSCLSRLMSHNPSDRPRSMDEVADILSSMSIYDGLTGANGEEVVRRNGWLVGMGVLQ